MTPFKFKPRPLLDLDSMKGYILMYKDGDGQYHCCTNLTDPVQIAGYKEMLNISFKNTFLHTELFIDEEFNNE